MLLFYSDVRCIEYLMSGFIYVVCILCTIRAMQCCSRQQRNITQCYFLVPVVLSDICALILEKKIRSLN